MARGGVGSTFGRDVGKGEDVAFFITLYEAEYESVWDVSRLSACRLVLNVCNGQRHDHIMS